jgi:hypothetical protein
MEHKTQISHHYDLTSKANILFNLEIVFTAISLAT